MHSSVKLETPIEFVNITPLNPLISKCQIKVCYVGDEPNRNGSVITKEVAKQMANSLPGCPIVGFYNEDKQDFEEHNRVIDISNGEFRIKDTTRPYGFVDLNAKVWFQKYMDDGMTEHEYLMTEGWLWTGQYPECRRILAQGNNQSMELDEDHLNANWSENDNGKLPLFIINEAVISKLCVLGEDNEPCFEGANVAAPTIQFAFDNGFKEQLFSMMNELKDYLKEGGEKVFNRYSVEIGDTLWTALYDHVTANAYTVESVCEDGEQKFAVVAAEDKYYRLNFSVEEDGTVAFADIYTLLEDYVPAEEPQFDAAAVAEYAASKAESKEDEDKEEEEEKCPKCHKPKSECECDKEEDKKDKYNLEEIQEYVELSEKYNQLNNEFAAAGEKIAELTAEIEILRGQMAEVDSLREFKAKVEKANKQKMIDSFYMLSDEDKKDVIDNIDTYSIDDIEAKLSIICVRNKVNFSLDEDNKPSEKGPMTYNLNNSYNDDAPAWIKAIRSVASDIQ